MKIRVSAAEVSDRWKHVGAEIERDQAEHGANYFRVRRVLDETDYVGTETQFVDDGARVC